MRRIKKKLTFRVHATERVENSSDYKPSRMSLYLALPLVYKPPPSLIYMLTTILPHPSHYRCLVIDNRNSGEILRVIEKSEMYCKGNNPVSTGKSTNSRCSYILLKTDDNCHNTIIYY